MSGNFILEEYPLIVQPTLAKALGINGAIIAQQIQYWTNHKSAPIRDGYAWHYATFKEWQEQFPWMAERTLKDNMAFLEKNNLVISYQPNKSKGDCTKWYRVDLDAIKAFCKPFTHSAKTALPSGKNCLTLRQKLHDVVKEEETTKETTKETKDNNIVHLRRTVGADYEKVLSSAISLGFQEFWGLYRNRKNKRRAIYAFVKARERVGVALEAVLGALKAQNAERDQKLERKEFTPQTPLAASWLNDCRWEDELEAQPTPLTKPMWK